MKIHDARQFINCDSDFSTVLRHLPPIDADGPWVAGGSVWKTIEKIPVESSDIDFFFKSAEQSERWFRTLLSMPYVHRIVSEPKANDYNTSLNYHVHYRNFNKTIKIQLISFAFFKDVAELLNGFDFTTCQFAFDGRNLFSGETSFDDLRNREIVFHNIRDNYATAIHLEKYVSIGFKPAASQIQKFDEIMRLRKPKYEEKQPGMAASYLYSYSSPSPLSAIPEPPRSNNSDDDYPRPSNIQGNQGINLVRATQMPTRPPRQESASIWGDIPAGNSGLVSGYASNTINTSYYSTESISAQEGSPAVTEPQCSPTYGSDTVNEVTTFRVDSNPTLDGGPETIYAPYVPVGSNAGDINPLTS